MVDLIWSDEKGNGNVRKLNEEHDKELIKEWYNRAEVIKNEEELSRFVHELIYDYEHDYGTIVHAIVAAMNASFTVINNSDQGGISGFQAAAVAWKLIPSFFGIHSDVPLRLLNYEDMLYPQFENKFLGVPEHVWKWIQERAKEKLDEMQAFGVALDNPVLVSHLDKIVQGCVPFGYKVIKEE